MKFRLGVSTRRLLMIGVFMHSLAGVAEAATYYVDSVSGSDSNSGTSLGAPWQTLTKVNATTFQPGDVVNFKRGSLWTGSTLVVDSSGVSGNLITYQAYGTGNRPEIAAPSGSWKVSINVTGDWNLVKDFLLRDGHQAGIQLSVGADHNTVQGVEVRNAGFGVFTQGQYNLITQNYVHDTKIIVSDATPSNDYGATCYWLEAPNNEVSYNRGINCRAPSIDFGHDGGFVEVWRSGDNSYIHHNYAENTNGFFELGASGNGSSQNVKVAYNIIYNVTASGSGTSICFNTGNYNINVTGFKFENNTFVSTAGHPDAFRVLGCRSDLSSIQVRNNIFYSDIQIASNGNFTRSNNLYHMVNMVSGSGVGYSLGAGEKTGNPLFLNLAAVNVHLLIGSPAIDAGANLGYAQDYDGRPVPFGSAPDIGVFEFGIGPTIPAAPTNLRISSRNEEAAVEELARVLDAEAMTRSAYR